MKYKRAHDPCRYGHGRTEVNRCESRTPFIGTRRLDHGRYGSLYSPSLPWKSWRLYPKNTGEFVDAASITIVLEPNAGAVTGRVATVLQERLQWSSRISVQIGSEPESNADLQIYLGRLGDGGRLDTLCADHDLRLPGRDQPAPEGYAVRSVRIENAPIILAAGADSRGVLYAAGEILRHMESKPVTASFKAMDVRTSPAYRFRGGGVSQGGTMIKITKARGWTLEEWKRAIMDNALAGANYFYAGWDGGENYEFLKLFDLMTVVGLRPNAMQDDFPDEWSAGGLDDWEGTHWVCPSIPEARRAILDTWTDNFKTLQDHDVMRMFAGDPGGCRDERCRPWGKTFVHLCEEIAAILRQTHPDINIQIANQDMSNEGDLAIFDYLAEKPRTWLYGLSYGPGSNAMSSYFRDELREDLFTYPGHGSLNRYLALTLNHLPKDKRIVHYSDITHWISAQYETENPERNIMKSYGRRTWHTRPKALYHAFQAIMPFSEGDIIYTEGYHDHFHQYLWYRLLWNSNRKLEDVMQEYCRLYFGEPAVDLMVDAMLQLEENLERRLATNAGVGRYYALVVEAGRRIPPHLMEKNHIWRLHRQKAALDRYNQLKLQRERFKEERIRNLLQESLESTVLDSAVEQALVILEETAETPPMAAYRKEARQFGDESERLFGVRNVGYPKLDQTLRDLPDILDALERAKAASSDAEKRDLVNTAIEIT